MTPNEYATQICLDIGIKGKNAPAELGDWLAMRLLADRCEHIPPQKGDPTEFAASVQDKMTPVEEGDSRNVTCACSNMHPETKRCALCAPVGFHSSRCSCGTVQTVLPTDYSDV